MGEPRDGILWGDRLDRHPHSLPERLTGASAEPAQNGFDLRECLLDRREVGRVGRQEEQVHVVGHREMCAGMPPRAIEDEHDPLGGSRPDCARERREFCLEAGCSPR